MTAAPTLSRRHAAGAAGARGLLFTVLGEFAGETLAGQREIPAKLTAAGYQFAHTELSAALRAELG